MMFHFKIYLVYLDMYVIFMDYTVHCRLARCMGLILPGVVLIGCNLLSELMRFGGELSR